MEIKEITLVKNRFIQKLKACFDKEENCIDCSYMVIDMDKNKDYKCTHLNKYPTPHDAYLVLRQHALFMVKTGWKLVK